MDAKMETVTCQHPGCIKEFMRKINAKIPMYCPNHRDSKSQQFRFCLQSKEKTKLKKEGKAIKHGAPRKKPIPISRPKATELINIQIPKSYNFTVDKLTEVLINLAKVTNKAACRLENFIITVEKVKEQ